MSIKLLSAAFEGARDDVRHEDSQISFLTNARRIYDDYVQFLVVSKKPGEALRWADFSRARTLSEIGIAAQGGFRWTASVRCPANRPPCRRHHPFLLAGRRTVLPLGNHATEGRPVSTPSGGRIKTRVERYRKAIIEQRESTSTASDDGAALYRILVEPAKDLLPKTFLRRTQKTGKSSSSPMAPSTA